MIDLQFHPRQVGKSTCLAKIAHALPKQSYIVYTHERLRKELIRNFHLPEKQVFNINNPYIFSLPSNSYILLDEFGFYDPEKLQGLLDRYGSKGAVIGRSTFPGYIHLPSYLLYKKYKDKFASLVLPQIAKDFNRSELIPHFKDIEKVEYFLDLIIDRYATVYVQELSVNHSLLDVGLVCEKTGKFFVEDRNPVPDLREIIPRHYRIEREWILFNPVPSKSFYSEDAQGPYSTIYNLL